MKKIILFIDNLGSGGAQRQIVNLAVLFQQYGYDVSLLVYQNMPFYQHYLDEQKIPVVVIESRNYVERLLAVRRYLRRSDADAVITFLETPGFIGCFSKMGGAKWRLITNELSAKLRTFTARRNRIFNWFERFSDAKVCNSENARGMWRKYYPQWDHKYRCIYNPVIMSREFPKLAQQHKRGDRFVITVAASYQGLKNPLRVIEAVHLLPKELQDQLLVVWHGRAEVTTGNTQVYDEAVASVEKYGLRECMHLKQETNQIYEVMANSDAVGLFSEVEGLPNTICEGMMLGKPIIMSQVSDYAILTDGNGVTCDPFSVESIRDAIARLLAFSQDEIAEMGKTSAEKAQKLFAPESITAQWVAVIEGQDGM